MAQRIDSPLIERLPRVRGRLSENAALAGITWFRVGGPAEVMFRPADKADLSAFLQAKPKDVPVTVIGVASNLLVRDGGIPGVTIRLGRDFASIAAEGSYIICGAAALDLNVLDAWRPLSLPDFGLERTRVGRALVRSDDAKCRPGAGHDDLRRAART